LFFRVAAARGLKRKSSPRLSRAGLMWGEGQRS